MYAVLIYGFPVILCLFEASIRFLVGVDTSGFLGPTLAAAGLTSMIATVQPKTQKMSIDNQEVFVISKSDYHFIPAAWILLFVFLFAWGAACYVSLKLSEQLLFGISLQFSIGLVVYIISILMVGIKGAL